MSRRSKPDPIYAPHFLEHYRKAAGLSQARLAEKAGTSQQRISDLENRQVDMDLQAADAYARALNVTPQEIIFGPEQPTAEERALLQRLRQLPPAKRTALLELSGAIDAAPRTTSPPPALVRLAEDMRIPLEDFDPELWAEIDGLTSNELAAIPEIGTTTPLQRADIVASLYLLAREDLEAGRQPDYSRMRLFIIAQARALRAQGRRRPQA